MVYGSIETIYNNKPTKILCEAVEETYLFVFDSISYNKFIENNQRLIKLKLILLEKALHDLHNRIEFLVLLDPEERYKFLLENEPWLIQRIPQKYLARFINVTPVSLSRIRARLSKENKFKN